MSTISLNEWIILFVITSLWWKWILSWGGASVLKGLGAYFAIGWFAWAWNEEQIRLYALLLWGAECIWFAVGIMIPEYRF